MTKIKNFFAFFEKAIDIHFEMWYHYGVNYLYFIQEADIAMKKYVSPVAIKVNFEANDIITASGMLQSKPWNNEGWNDSGVMSISWTELIGGNNNQ